MLSQLKLAQEHGKKIRRAAGVARFNGWTTGIFAAITLLGGVFSLTSLLLGVALAVVAHNEFNGAKLLRRLDQRAPRRLGYNQLGLCGVVIVYSLWSIYSMLTGPSPYESALAAGGQAAQMLGSIEQLHTTLIFGVYGSLIFVSLVVQGGNAWYYFTRARQIQAYSTQTPQWIIDLQQSGSPF